MEQWGELETTPFKTIHIDDKGPLRPSSNSNNHYLVVVDAFSRFIGVYPVKDTCAQATITALEKWITSYGITQKIIHNNGTAFINSDFINWTKEFGITLAPRTTYSPRTNGKVEVQNQHLTRYWRNFTNESGNNRSKLAPKFPFAHNTSVNYTTGLTPIDKTTSSYDVKTWTNTRQKQTMQIRISRRITTTYTQRNSTTKQIPGSITQTTTFRRTYCSRKRLQMNLFVNLSTMPPNYFKSTRIQEPIQTRTTDQHRTESVPRKSHCRLEQIAKVETITCWPFYSH